MTPKDVLNERLRRLAEHVRFRYYVVCSDCFGPIILVQTELHSPPTHLACGDCGKLVLFDPTAVQDFAPHA